MEDWRSIIERQKTAEEQEQVQEQARQLTTQKASKEQAKKKELEKKLPFDPESEVLKAFRIREKLEYIKREVWGVGEIERYEDERKGSNGVLTYKDKGYQLIHRYPSCSEYGWWESSYCDAPNGGSTWSGTGIYYMDTRRESFSIIEGNDYLHVGRFWENEIPLRNFPKNVDQLDEKIKIIIAKYCQDVITSKTLPYNLEIYGEAWIKNNKPFPTKEEAKRAYETGYKPYYRKTFWQKLLG